MVVAVNDGGSVLLERRPESGVWGGLWCLPQFDTDSAARAYISHSLQPAPPALQSEPRSLASVEHAFTHFNLVMTPLIVRCAGESAVMEEGSTLWYNLKLPARVGLPAPIRNLLARVADET